MYSFRSLYGRLPQEIRVKIKALFPKEFLRWFAHWQTDVYLISYPKCGRTWLRLMMGWAISKHFSLPQNEDILFLRTNKRLVDGFPRITIIHEDRPMLKAPYELETSKVKFRDKKVVFLVRDPRDVIVSSYFEMSKRGHHFGNNPYEARKAAFEGDLCDFIHRKIGGFDTILEYYNIWAENRSLPKGFLLVRYEDMLINPQLELQRVMTFLGLESISNQIIEQAVDFTSFENMRRMETEGRFLSGILKPADRSDDQSYKTRKGKVGGYADHLNEETIKLLNFKMTNNLSEFFGYNP